MLSLTCCEVYQLFINASEIYSFGISYWIALAMKQFREHPEIRTGPNHQTKTQSFCPIK